MNKHLISYTLLFLIPCLSIGQLLKINLDNDSTYSSYAHVNSISDDTRIILIGENHTYLDYNAQLQLRTFQYLHEHKNVNTLMFEFGEGFSYLVGNYIRQTDDSLAKQQADLIQTIFFDQQFGLYDSLRNYYKQQLSINKPFTIISGDIDHNLDLGIIALAEILKFKKCNDSISDVCGALVGLRDHYYNKFKKLRQSGTMKSSSGEKSDVLQLRISELRSMEEIVRLYEEKLPFFKEALGEDFAAFHTIMESFKKGLKWKNYQNERNIINTYYRENLMYLKLLDYLRNHPEEKIFAQYGRCHIADTAFNDQCNYESFKSFAQRLKESPHIDLANKVVLIPQFYVNGNNKNLNFKAEISKLMTENSTIDKTKEGVYTYKIDTAGSFKKLFGIYDYLIINTSFQDQEYLYGPGYGSKKDDEKEREIEDFWGYVQLEGYQSYHMYRLGGLNDRLISQGFSSISSPIITYGGGISVYEPKYIYGHLGFEYWNPISIVRGDTSSITMNGYTLNLRLGKTVLDNDIFQLVPYLGYSHSVSRLKENTPWSVPSLLVDSFNEQLVFTNKAAQLDAGFDFKLHYKFLGIDLKTGYRLDVSGRDWKTSSAENIGLPTAFSGFYFSVGGSIVIGYY
jgi:uncharacterized iron-regulated protein